MCRSYSSESQKKDWSKRLSLRGNPRSKEVCTTYSPPSPSHRPKPNIPLLFCGETCWSYYSSFTKVQHTTTSDDGDVAEVDAKSFHFHWGIHLKHNHIAYTIHTDTGITKLRFVNMIEWRTKSDDSFIVDWIDEQTNNNLLRHCTFCFEFSISCYSFCVCFDFLFFLGKRCDHTQRDHTPFDVVASNAHTTNIVGITSAATSIAGEFHTDHHHHTEEIQLGGDWTFQYGIKGSWFG